MDGKFYKVEVVRDWWNAPLSRDYYNVVNKATGEVVKTYKRLLAARQRVNRLDRERDQDARDVRDGIKDFCKRAGLKQTASNTWERA